MSHYQEVEIETFIQHGESSRSEIRAKPVAGQGFATSMRVECSKSMRARHPVGTRFRILARLKSKDGGESFLYCHYNAKYIVVEQQESN